MQPLCSSTLGLPQAVHDARRALVLPHRNGAYASGSYQRIWAQAFAPNFAPTPIVGLNLA